MLKSMYLRKIAMILFMEDGVNSSYIDGKELQEFPGFDILQM